MSARLSDIIIGKMPLITSLLLIVTLVLCGAYAGLALMCQIGVLPAMRQLRPNAYADAWQAMDGYMDRSMPPFKVSLLLLNLAACGVLIADHRQALATCCAISFVLSLAGLVLTIRKQLPLNTMLKTLPAGTPDHVLLRIREQTVRNFSVRFVLASLAFITLSVGVLVWPVY